MDVSNLYHYFIKYNICKDNIKIICNYSEIHMFNNFKEYEIFINNILNNIKHQIFIILKYDFQYFNLYEGLSSYQKSNFFDFFNNLNKIYNIDIDLSIINYIDISLKTLKNINYDLSNISIISKIIYTSIEYLLYTELIRFKYIIFYSENNNEYENIYSD